MKLIFRLIAVGATMLLWSMPLAGAQDITGVQEHPMISRYPGQNIRWQQIENYMVYRVPVGSVSGYQSIDEWIETQGRVSRTFYVYEGSDRSYSEFYLNYLEALKEQGFEILGEGISDTRRGTDIGSRKWTGILFNENPTGSPGEVGTMFAGTSSQGGAGAIIARKDRAAGMAYVVINVEQHSSNYIGTLIDIIEVEAAETGLIIVDAEAIGSDITEFGRVVLDGIVFDFDKATLKPESGQALSAIVEYLAANPDKVFYVVGHTDSVGSFAYNQTLSAKRAQAVVAALQAQYGIAPDRLEAHGIGPLVPVFANGTEAGRERNRRVELVERPAEQ